MLVAHFSDIHLLSLEGVRLRDFVGKRVTGGLNLLLNRGGEFPVSVAQLLVEDMNRQQPDYVVFSGDLTNLALPAEFWAARELLERLQLPVEQVTVVPGNHDAYTREAFQADHFGRVMEPFLHGDGDSGLGRFPLLRVRGELAVVALSSAIPSAPLLAIGELGETQLRAAERILTGDACRDRFRLVVLHHPPQHPRAHWHNRLRDEGELLAMLRRTGAELVAHGHLHRFSQLSIPGPDTEIPMLGVGSGAWLSPKDPERRAQYNLYELQGKQLVRVRRRQYDSASGGFEEL